MSNSMREVVNNETIKKFGVSSFNPPTIKEKIPEGVPKKELPHIPNDKVYTVQPGIIIRFPFNTHPDYNVIGFMMAEPEKLKTTAEYQRTFERIRFKRIVTSIRNSGFWFYKIILVNEDFEVIDGQHELNAAKECGEKYVLICVIKFKDKKTEAKFFSDYNSFQTNLSMKDLFEAKYQSDQDCVAKYIYQLNSSETSLLFDKISIRDVSTKYRYTIPDIMRMFYYVCLGSIQHFEYKKTERLNSQLSRLPYKYVEENINNFVKFINDTWGEWVPPNKYKPNHLKSQIMGGIIRFYIECQKIKVLDGKEYRTTVEKMKSFDFKQCTSLRPEQVTSMLVQKFNTKRKEDKKIKFSYIIS